MNRLHNPLSGTESHKSVRSFARWTQSTLFFFLSTIASREVHLRSQSTGCVRLMDRKAFDVVKVSHSLMAVLAVGASERHHHAAWRRDNLLVFTRSSSSSAGTRPW